MQDTKYLSMSATALYKNAIIHTSMNICTVYVYAVRGIRVIQCGAPSDTKGKIRYNLVRVFY